jgi:uncharacterized protein
VSTILMAKTLEDRHRLCISCRKLFPRKNLIRVTANKQNEFSIDQCPQLEGRSVYVCRQQQCLEEALRARRFQRSLKRGIPDVIVENLRIYLAGMAPRDPSPPS